MYLLEPNKPNGAFIREYGFLRNVCIKGRVERCQAAGPKQYFRHSSDVLKAKWYQFHEIDSNEDNYDAELEEIDMLLESDVTKYTTTGNVGNICTGDDHNCYLAKLITIFMKQENLEWMITTMRCLYIKKLLPTLTWRL